MSLSIQARAIAPSPTFALIEQASILRAKGEPVINLGIGEPKNRTPINAILSSSAKLRVGDVKYSRVDGMPSLKKAVIIFFIPCSIPKMKSSCWHLTGSAIPR